jgi:hypothetical protein
VLVEADPLEVFVDEPAKLGADVGLCSCLGKEEVGVTVLTPEFRAATWSTAFAQAFASAQEAAA